MTDPSIPPSLIGPVARKLFGEPNRRLSSRNQLRFGTHGSLAVEIAGGNCGTWYDHERNEGGGILDLLRRERRLSNGAALEWLRTEFGSDIGGRALSGSHPSIVATYDYHDADDQLVFQVVRYSPKDFRQRRPDDKGGWIWNVKNVALVPYRLPQLLALAREPDKLVFIVEGEKDVLALEALGMVATCNPGGATKEAKSGGACKSKWPESFAQYFQNRNVAIPPDNDEPGHCHARAVAQSLVGHASQIRIVALPGLDEKGDVSDWLEAGGTPSELMGVVGRTALHSAVVPLEGPLASDNEGLYLKIGSDIEIASRVTEDLERRYGQIVFCGGQLWSYRTTQWEAIPDEAQWLAASRYDGAFFRTIAGTLSRVSLNKARIESILACMRPSRTLREFFDSPAVGINCESGFIVFDRDGHPRLEAHSLDHRCRHTLPGRWPTNITEEQRETSLLERLLNGSFKDDYDKRNKCDLLAEVAGMAALGLATKIINPKALILKGELAENGKSQVLDVLRSLLPKSAIASISPARFNDRTFTCHLDGKLLNAPDELAGGDAIASETFKRIITGEPLTVRDVYQSAFEFRPRAQHVYATNNLRHSRTEWTEAFAAA